MLQGLSYLSSATPSCSHIFRFHGRNIYPLSGPRESLLFLYLAHHWRAFLGDLLQPHFSLQWKRNGVCHHDVRLLGALGLSNSSVPCAETLSHSLLCWNFLPSPLLSSAGAWWWFGGWLPGFYPIEPLVGYSSSAASPSEAGHYLSNLRKGKPVVY